MVTAYEDHARERMLQDDTGAGQLQWVRLRPRVTISAGSDPDHALAIHVKVPDMCFIARSVNFPVGHEPTITVEEPARS